MATAKVKIMAVKKFILTPVSVRTNGGTRWNQKEQPATYRNRAGTPRLQ